MGTPFLLTTALLGSCQQRAGVLVSQEQIDRYNRYVDLSMAEQTIGLAPDERRELEILEGEFG